MSAARVYRAVTCATTLRVTTGSTPSTSPTGGAKVFGCLSDAKLDKPRFVFKAQVMQKALPPPLPWLAHLCSLSLSSAATLAGAVLQERNAPTAATSARENGTTSCSDVQTAHRNGECHFRSLGHSAQHSYSSLLHKATISLRLALAVVYGRGHPKLSGGPGADTTARHGPKNDRRRPSHPDQRRDRVTTSRSSDRLL